MNYFFLKNSTDSKIIGRHYPQLAKAYEGFWGPDRLRPFGVGQDGYPKVTSRLMDLQLFKQAKVTDWISSAQLPYPTCLISERFFNLLQGFKIMPFIALEAQLLHKNKEYVYWHIHFPDTFDEFIDFKKSKFYLGDSFDWIKDVKLESYEEYKNKWWDNRISISKETGGIISILELFLDPEKVQLDLFRINRLAGFIISERLKNTIEKEGLTGIRFEPAQGYKIRIYDRSTTPPSLIT